MTQTVTFGTVSHGTLRNEDLLEAFADELENHVQRNADHWCGNQTNRDLIMKTISDAREIDPDVEEASEIIEEMVNALNNEFAPSFTYFGAHPGDGSDFGFWPDIGGLEMAVQDGEVYQVNDLADIPSDINGEIMLVNDHGNVTLGCVPTAGANFVEIWSCV